MIKTTPIPPNATSNPAQVEHRIGTEIRNIGIPPRPAILGRIESEMRQDQPDYRLLADMISSDVGLAGSIIKVANSPFFGFGKKVRSIPEALLVLGLKMTLHTVAGISLQRLFPRIPSLDRFWDSTAKTARLSGWLALHYRERIKVRPDDAFTFGLFRDCGIPLLMIPFPAYAQTLRQANEDEHRIFTAIEDEIYTINHAMVGSELAEDWLLPNDLILAIRYHHEPAAVANQEEALLPIASQQLIAIGQIAEYLIQQVTGMNQTHEWTKLGKQSQLLLGITNEELAGLASEAEDVINAAL